TRNTLPRPSSRAALLARILQPNVQRIFVGVSMQRLKAGNHAKPSESGNVLGGYGLNVLDAVPRIVSGVGFRCRFVSIQRRAYRLVADGVRVDLYPSLVESLNVGAVALHIPSQ